MTAEQFVSDTIAVTNFLRQRFGKERIYLMAHSWGSYIGIQAAALFFTENETNSERLFGVANDTPYKKDSFHRYLIEGETGAINPARTRRRVLFPLPLRPSRATTSPG